MSLLSFLLIISSIVFFFFALDAIQRRKFNFLHILIFGGGSLIVGFFTFYPGALERFGKYFGVARGADIIVYSSLIILFRLYFIMYNKALRQDIRQTEIIRYSAIVNAHGSIDKQTAIIMPTYKQGTKVITLIKSIIDSGYGVILIDDGYNGNLLQSVAPEFTDNLIIIKHPFNIGQGAAIQTGQQYIKEFLPNVEYIVHFDSDGQHQVKDIKNFVQAFQKDPILDIVLGSRFLPSAQQIPKKRALHKKMQILFMKLFVGIKLTDTNNGFRMLRRDTLDKLQITMNGYAHASEIEAIIVRNNLSYAEVPVDIVYEEEHLRHGQKLSNAWNIAKNIIYNQFFFK